MCTRVSFLSDWRSVPLEANTGTREIESYRRDLGFRCRHHPDLASHRFKARTHAFAYELLGLRKRAQLD